MNNNRTEKIVKQFADDCIQCGVCQNSCSILSELGITPGEIAQALIDNRLTDPIRNAILRCDLCGLCGVGCLVNLRPDNFITTIREILMDSGKISVDDYQTMLVDQDWNFFSIYRNTYGISYEDLVQEKYDTLFFPGCTLSCYSPEITRACYDWLSAQGMNLGYSDLCCGKPLASIGLAGRTKKLQHHLWEQIQEAGASQLVTACPNCYYHLHDSLPGIEVISLYDLMEKSGLRLNGQERLSIHDSCPDRYGLKIGEEIRKLFNGHTLVEMEHSRNNTICCGSGGIVSMIDPEICSERAKYRLTEWDATKTDHCIVSCMACAHRLSRAAKPGAVLHALEIIFNIFIDYSLVEYNTQAMWEGDWGKYNLMQLSNSKIFTKSIENL